MTTKRNSARATSLKPRLSLSVHQHYFNFIKALIIALPPLLFCSYYPLISLGTSESMNFELSLPLIWLMLFGLATLPFLVRAWHSFKPTTIALAAALPLYATLSIFWSANPTRAILTVGIYWLIVYAILMLIYLLKPNSPLFDIQKLPKSKTAQKSLKFFQNRSQFLKTFWRVFFISSLLICAFCWLQCILDIAGVDRSATLLCEGCTYSMFGFPHPSGLAIEPQFMGNLLLAPTLAALYLLVFRKTAHRRALMICAFAFAATLFLTFSRGAIYAFAIALVILLILAIRRRRFRPVILTVPITAFIAVLICQGVFATLSPTSDNFITATTKSIHQLSLGIIDLRPEEIKTDAVPSDAEITSSVDAENNTSSAETAVETSEQNSTETSNSEISGSETSVFSGYVAGSTNTRLSLTSDALQVWTQSPANFLFGTGLGSAGAVLYQNNLTSSPKEIVQNEYASILLELGVIGLLLAVILIAFIYYQFYRADKKQPAPLLISLFTAYLITFCFFSGPANALQIYLLPSLLLFLLF